MVSLKVQILTVMGWSANVVVHSNNNAVIRIDSREKVSRALEIK